MIVLKELCKRYGSVSAVEDLSFTVKDREVVGFLGPNGAGKSSTLRMLAGFLAPSSGTATVAGFDVFENSLEVRRRIGYLPESNPLYEEMDVSEFLEWTGEVRGLKGQALTRGVRRSVEACVLGEVLSKPIGFLSKGYRQRTGLAAAILHNPEILLLDEPTSGLDPNQTAQVRSLINELRLEKTVLLSTHLLSEVEASCDRVVILNHGTIAAQGTPYELAARGSQPRVTAVFRSPTLSENPLREGLEGIDGVLRVSLELHEDMWSVALDAAEGADPREAVFRLAAERGWPLLELRREEASLEKVFRELTPQ